MTLGTDFTTRSGLTGALISEQPLLVESLARRLRTRRGALWYDPDYGSSLPEYLGERFEDGGAEVAAICELDLEGDPRVLSAEVTIESVDLRGVRLRADVTTRTGTVALILDARYANTLYPPEIEVIPNGAG